MISTSLKHKMQLTLERTPRTAEFPGRAYESEGSAMLMGLDHIRKQVSVSLVSLGVGSKIPYT